MSITVNADSVTLDDFPYKMYFSYQNYYYAIISKGEITTAKLDANSPPDNYIDGNSGLNFEATNTQEWYAVQGQLINGTQIKFYECYLLVWYPTGWRIQNGFEFNRYICLFPTGSKYNPSTTQIEGFPLIEFESLESAINDLKNELNSTSQSSAIANQIIYNINNEYNSYLIGELSKEDFSNSLNSYSTTLNEISQNTGNTLADNIAITNAITALQTAQDKINTDTISNQIKSILDEYIKQHQFINNLGLPQTASELKSYCSNLKQEVIYALEAGLITYDDAVAIMDEIIVNVTTALTIEGITEKEIGYINSLIALLSESKKSLDIFLDIDKEVEQNSINSDNIEKEYLSELTSETTDNINSLKNKVDKSISASEADRVKSNVITPLLQNTLITKLLPIAALFMVLAVTLGFKYKL